MACQQFLHSVLPWPTHHFRTELFGQSFRHGCFIMETIRHVHPLALRTFRQMDISTRESFDLGNFRQGEFSAQGIFGTMDISARDILVLEKIWHMDILAPCKSIWMFWHRHFDTCVSVPKCPCAEMFLCRNVHMPKIYHAKNSSHQKLPMLKRYRVETSICQNVRSTKWWTCQMFL
jgi:hypothetical protein